MASEEEKRQAEEAKAMVKAVYDDGHAEINGRSYVFLKMTHKQRRRVFAFYTRVARAVNAEDFSFLDAPDFEPVEAVILNAVTLDGSLLSKLGEKHFEDFPEDYLPFITTAMAVVSYPFLAGSPTA